MFRNCTIPRARSLCVWAGAIVMAALLAACSPALNWRELRLGEGPLGLMLPCKPDKADKVVPLGGRPTTLSMMGCDAAGATFAVAMADLGDAAAVPEVLAQWQSLTLANMKAEPLGQLPTQSRALKVPGAAAAPAPVLVMAQGRRADGVAVQGWTAYFSRGSRVFQAVLYAPRITPEAADTFFSSLKLD